MALAVIFSTIKNPQKKASLRAAMLKLYRAVKSMYPGDPDFS